MLQKYAAFYYVMNIFCFLLSSLKCVKMLCVFKEIFTFHNSLVDTLFKDI